MGDEIEKETKGKDDMERIKPQFAAGVLEPRYVYLMRTNKDVAALSAKMFEEIKKDLPFVPEELLKVAVLDKTMKSASLFEYHGMVAAENLKEGNWQIYLADYREREGKQVLNSFLGDIDADEHSAKGNTRLNAMRIQHTPDWKGEREQGIEIEVESYSEFMGELDKDPKAKEMFMSLYPETITSDSPITAGVPSVMVKDPTNAIKELKAIEKKYGKKAAEALMKRVTDKGIPS